MNGTSSFRIEANRDLLSDKNENSSKEENKDEEENENEESKFCEP